ncbi:MAG: YggT family protein [Saccharospirillum sp.]|jgi:YggT family protein
MLGELAVLLLKTAFSLLIIALVARFLAQIARADVSNPLAQTVLKITSPVLMPVRRVVPGLGGLDLASLVCIFIAQLVLAFLISIVLGNNPVENLGQLVVWSMIAVAGIILTVLQWSMIIVAVGSWLTMGGGGPNPLLTFLSQMVEPFVGPFRKLNLQIGMLDLSYIVAFLVLIILRDFILRGLILPGTGFQQALMYGYRGMSPVVGI